MKGRTPPQVRDTGGLTHCVRRVMLAVALGMALAMLSDCRRSNRPSVDAAGAADDTVQPVQVATVTRQPAPLAIRAIGTVEPLASVTIQSQIDGRLLQVSFSDGQLVREGDILFEIDPRPSQAALQLAKANLARDQALAIDAQREAERVAALFAQGRAAGRERDQAQADADAKAAQVRADQAMIEQAGLELEYCTIRSPLSGRVGARFVDAGTIVKAKDTKLVELNQINPIYVTFAVAEHHLDTIRRYESEGDLEVQVQMPQADAPPERGRLTFTDNRIDRNTGMIRLRGTFVNEHNRMWPGQYVQASLILTTRPEATVVPTRAVQNGPAGQFVFVVDHNHKIEMRPVRIADALDELSVVEEGLQVGEQIVTDGQLRLAPGCEVRILSSNAERPSQPHVPAPADGDA